MEFDDRLWYPELVVRQGFDIDQTLLGKAFHRIMATCSTVEEVPDFIQLLEDQSEVLTEHRAVLHEMAARIFSDNTYRTWIDNAITIYSEPWIMTPEGTLVRPDKIMVQADKIMVIDFKTGKHQAAHKLQLSEYMNTLSQMMPQPVEGYLYYCQSGEWIAS